MVTIICGEELADLVTQGNPLLIHVLCCMLTICYIPNSNPLCNDLWVHPKKLCGRIPFHWSHFLEQQERVECQTGDDEVSDHGGDNHKVSPVCGDAHKGFCVHVFSGRELYLDADAVLCHVIMPLVDNVWQTKRYQTMTPRCTLPSFKHPLALEEPNILFN